MRFTDLIIQIFIAIAVIGLGICIFISLAHAEPDIESLIPYIIQQESRGNPHAVSEKGAIGLMQITPIVLREYCQEEIGDLVGEFTRINQNILFDRDKNIMIGTWYLNRLKDHYLKDDFTIPRLLSCYNAGPTKMKKLNWNIDKAPKETRDYVYKIIKNWNIAHPLDPIKYKDLGNYVK